MFTEELEFHLTCENKEIFVNEKKRLWSNLFFILIWNEDDEMHLNDVIKGYSFIERYFITCTDIEMDNSDI